jgi:nicotinate-nucleotide adenylyltransferase
MSPTPPPTPPTPPPPPSDNHIERHHHPVAIPASIKDAPARLFFGGSFDPPHLAHTTLADQAAQQLEIALGLAPNSCTLVYVPASRSPHKDSAPTPDQHRVEMLKLAIDSIERPATVWTQELADGLLNESAPSYWADTWSIVRLMMTTGTNHFLIGTDQALSMHRWHRYTEFWKDAVVILRGESKTDQSVTNLISNLDEIGIWDSDDLHHWEQSCIELETLPYSSTAIRQQLADLDRSKEKPRIEGLDPGVVSYIIEHGLYRELD